MKLVSPLHLLPLALLLVASPLAAQDQPLEHAPDGGTRETVMSIDIPTIPNAPFSATVTTELTTIMPDGSKRTIWNHRLVARDSAGHVFQERRAFTPTGNTEATRLGQTDYLDPIRHERTICSAAHVCRVSAYNRIITPSAPNATPPGTVTLKDGTTIEREDLGRNTIEDVAVTGSREITTIPAGLIGNEKPQPIVKEFWYAPRLGVNLITKRFDPRVSAIQNFTVSHIDLNEPSPSLFQLPQDARIVNMDPQ